MLNLLTINLPREFESQLISTLQSQNFEIEHLGLTREEITQSVFKNSFWDLVVISEDHTPNFELLPFVTSKFPAVPIIFLSERISESLYRQTINAGATDCLSPSSLYRLPKILDREDFKGKKGLQKSLIDEIIDLTNDAILLFETHTLKCCYANQTAKQKLGYSETELYQLSPSELYTEYSTDTFSELVNPLLSDQRDEICACTNLQRKSGAIYPSEVYLKKVIRNPQSYFLAINTDISSKWYKVLKLKRQRHTTKTYIQKHKQKQKLLANAAHDMRTSLESIILSNKLLFDKQNDFPEGYGKYQKAIHFSGKHLLNYINEFFDPDSEGHDLTSDLMNLKTFSQKLYLVFNPIAKRNEIKLDFDTSSLQHDTITTNQTYVKRILKNLLANAFKFTNEGSVTFKVYSVSEQHLQDQDLDSNSAIAFQVKDTGIGIPEEQQAQIFKRHQRTVQNKSGSGLGLHISKRLTKAIGGALTVDSTVGKGSVFTLYLPIYQNPETHIAKPSSNEHSFTHAQNKQKQDKSILIIDDSEVHNLALREYLNYTFKNCLTASSQQDAYKILETHHIDCIVTDYTLKDCTCLDFLKKIRKKETYASTPAIVYTGKKLTKEEHAAITSYADTLIKKKSGSYDRLASTISSFFEDPPS